MPVHVRARAAPRHELPAFANAIAPFVILVVTLFIVYQVNHHAVLEGMIQEGENLDAEHHFATGGRIHQEVKNPFAGATQSLREKFNSFRLSTSSNSTPSGTLGTTDAGLGNTGSATVQGTTTTTSSSSTSSVASTATKLQDDKLPHKRAGIPGSCNAEPNSEYHGDVVAWGDKNMVDSARACCESCKAHAKEGCNVWVYCGEEGGCDGQAKGQCWLKKNTLKAIMQQYRGKGHTGISWTSGVLYTPDEMKAYQKRYEAEFHAETARLAQLRKNESLPLVWLDVSIRGKYVGRMEFVLFTHISPLAAECFRRLCTGEVSARHTLKDASFYRIIDAFIDQSGIEVKPSPLGGMFKDDPAGLLLKHDRKGLLSVANMGPNTNTGHFSIMMNPAPHLNTHYVIFGEMVSGFHVADQVNELSRGRPNNELLHSQDAKIVNVGQIRQGIPVPQSVIDEGLVNHTS